MFSVLHKSSGQEYIFEAESVTFDHSNDRLTCHYSPGKEVDGYVIRSGSIFVMNSNGKTVATYHLGEPQIEPR